MARKNKLSNQGPPKISPGRIDNSTGNTMASGRDDRIAQAFIQGKEPVQSLSIRLPKSLWEKVRRHTFFQGTTINQLVVELLEQHLREREMPDEEEF